MSVRIIFFAFVFLTSLPLVCLAYVPDVYEQCKIDNLAVCEMKGHEFHVESACPSTARTIREPGTQDCAAYAKAYAEKQKSVTPGPDSLAIQSKAAPKSERVHSRLESETRSLLSVRLLVVLAVLAAVVLVVLLIWALRGGRMKTGARIDATGLAIWLGAAMLGGYGAYRLAGYAFNRVFSSYNHDTFAPILIAVPAAVVAFALAAPILTGLVALLFLGVKRLLQGSSGQAGSSPK